MNTNRTSLPEAEAKMDEANALVQGGKNREAEALCKLVLESTTDIGGEDLARSRARHVLGFVALREGRIHEALDLLVEAARRPNESPLLFMHLGIAQGMTGSALEAVESLQKAVALEPRFADAHYNLGLTLDNLKRHEEATESFHKATALVPRHAPSHEGMGTALLNLNRPEEAIEYLDRALEVNPDNATAHNQKGLALSAMNNHASAYECLKKAAELFPQSAEILMNLGRVSRTLYKNEEALNLYEYAVRLLPDSAKTHAALGAALEKNNRIDEAFVSLKRALDINPEEPLANISIARLELRDKELDEAESRLVKVLKTTKQDWVIKDASNILGLVLDKRGQYQRAFEAFSQCNEKSAASTNTRFVSKNSYPDQIRAYRQGVTAQMVKEWPRRIDGDDNGAPVFFVGFPRSGTTLVEQMLCSHPSFISGGEHDWLEQVAKQIPNKLPKGLQRLSEADVRELRRFYWQLARDFHGDALDDKSMVDKYPLNIVNLAIVRRLFPEAKVLFALRDPRDVVLSCFMQKFRINRAMVHFLNLEDTANFYAITIDLWLYYRGTLGLDYFEYRYEDLVEDPDATARQIIEALGESWSDNVLEYHRHVRDRSIMTPSYQDVSTSVYKSARKRWHNYKSQLAPVVPILKPFIREFGYPIS